MADALNGADGFIVYLPRSLDSEIQLQHVASVKIERAVVMV